MRVRRFWPLTKHKLLYANLVVYGAIIVLVLAFDCKLIWARKTLCSYAFSGKLPPPAEASLIQEAMEIVKTGGDIEQAQRLLERALQIDPHGQARLLLGACYLGQGDEDKALEYYDRYRSINPSSIEVYMEIGKILEKKHNSKALDRFLTDGIEYFRRRIELYKPRYDFTVPKEFNLKTLKVYNESQEALKYLEKMQEKLRDSK